MVTTKDILSTWTLDREQVLRDNYAKKNIKASGKFGESIRHEITDNSTTIFGNKYIGGTIYGRRANADQSKEGIRKWVGAFGFILSRWAVSKGLPAGIGWAVANKIALHGWQIPNRHGNDGRLLKDTFTTESIDNLKRELGKIKAVEVTEITQQIFEKWQQ